MNTLLTKLRNFESAYNELLTEWHTNTEQCDAVLNTMYPFKESFDEININDWVLDAQERLIRITGHEHNTKQCTCNQNKPCLYSDYLNHNISEEKYIKQVLI